MYQGLETILFVGYACNTSKSSKKRVQYHILPIFDDFYDLSSPLSLAIFQSKQSFWWFLLIKLKCSLIKYVYSHATYLKLVKIYIETFMFPTSIFVFAGFWTKYLFLPCVARGCVLFHEWSCNHYLHLPTVWKWRFVPK